MPSSCELRDISWRELFREVFLSPFDSLSGGGKKKKKKEFRGLFVLSYLRNKDTMPGNDWCKLLLREIYSYISAELDDDEVEVNSIL